MTLKLNKVTLICFDTRNIEAAIFSMSMSLRRVNFAESILFTSSRLCSEALKSKAAKDGIKLEYVSEISSVTEYSLFILSNLSSYIKTDFCLITQWDGWIINPKLWNPEFLKYDYIGAIWPNYSENQVGNGGFSLRSKKLLNSTRDFINNKPNFTIPLVEDDYICRKYRIFFEQNYNIMFASKEVANKFSVERNGLPVNSFGFHGMYNFNFVIKEDAELLTLMNKLTDDCYLTRDSYDLTKFLIKSKRMLISKLIIKKRFKIIGLSTKNIKLLFYYLFRLL